MTETMSETMSKIEALAAANIKPAVPTPVEEWDQAVGQWMERDKCSRSAAVDRILARTDWGSALWQRACTWDAAQPKILADGTRSGNWGNRGTGIVRRVPRAP
jgi:hypothetical protein